MNIRGGNGYIEEWVNARLVRDSYLGAIWEGARNVVALDAQRAILRERAHEALLALVRARLDGVTESAARPWADEVRRVGLDLERRIGALDGLDRSERELAARPIADGLYHVLAASLLLAEGQILRNRSGDYRKFFVASCYVWKWLRAAPAPGVPLFATRDLAWFDHVVDWTPLPADSLERAPRAA
jgi:hypothetical protein